MGKRGGAGERREVKGDWGVKKKGPLCFYLFVDRNRRKGRGKKPRRARQWVIGCLRKKGKGGKREKV